jgi:hypothetical protein
MRPTQHLEATTILVRLMKMIDIDIDLHMFGGGTAKITFT